MNKERLKAAEQEFLSQFPGGFLNPEMIKIGKKHQVPLRIKQSQEFFAEECFSQPQIIAENMVKTISRSSMVSVFEKPRPSYEFYTGYRNQIIAMRDMVDESLTSYNAAFSGFLMMMTRSD